MSVNWFGHTYKHWLNLEWNLEFKWNAVTFTIVWMKYSHFKRNLHNQKFRMREIDFLSQIPQQPQFDHMYLWCLQTEVCLVWK